MSKPITSEQADKLITAIETLTAAIHGLQLTLQTPVIPAPGLGADKPNPDPSYEQPHIRWGEPVPTTSGAGGQPTPYGGVGAAPRPGGRAIGGRG